MSPDVLESIKRFTGALAAHVAGGVASETNRGLRFHRANNEVTALLSGASQQDNMSANAAWPPRSPHAALLSSPTGRKKYADIDRSPVKRSAQSPGLLERLRAARANSDILSDPPEEAEEDEETLQLQLAAIEAKLKLKKIQQNKAKVDAERQTPAPFSSRPSSSAASAYGYTGRYGGAGRSSGEKENVQVMLSPTKRIIQPSEPRSPGRVLLGIDKGVKAADVSLRRAKNTIDYNSRSREGGGGSLSRANSRSGALRSDRSIPTGTPTGSKSFSERMTAVRDGGRTKDLKRGAALRERNTGFKVNPTEVEGFRSAAERGGQRARSPVKPYTQPGYSREDVLLAKDLVEGRGLKKSSTLPNLHPASRPPSRGQDFSSPRSHASLFEGFSGIDLASRILPHSFLKRTLPEEEYKVFNVQDLLRDITSPAYELPDDVGNYVVFGIIAAKSAPRDHKQKAEDHSVGNNDWERKWEDGSNNTRKFIVMTLTDLNWSLDLFLFGTAVPRYHRLTPGTVVAILNPTIMPPKKGKEDTGAFSLTLHNGEDTVLEIGQARNLGYCNAKRKDGKDCGQWVNAAKTEVCEFHLNLQLHRTQSQRMGINGGNTSFGGNGNAPKSRGNVFDSRRKGIREGEGRGGARQPEGKRYSQYTGHYYVSAAAPSVTRAPGSAAPFMADAQESRDKKTLLKKRQEAQAREEEIATQLGSWESGKAGSEYLRHRSGTATPAAGHRSKTGEGSQRSVLSARSHIMRSKSDAGRNGNGKRAADSVRLSPIKKTRFLTEKGIREAGRESLGVAGGGDDDDLDIV